ncbi:MAG: hypothetical protein MAG453_01844 [Calditrichaeota bacterium]|nr:hypothetical protein [Calditrichota bacterium]
MHREYVQAGARFLETNTFGANPFKLGKFGLAEHGFERAHGGGHRADVVRAGPAAAADDPHPVLHHPFRVLGEILGR